MKKSTWVFHGLFLLERRLVRPVDPDFVDHKTRVPAFQIEHDQIRNIVGLDQVFRRQIRAQDVDHVRIDRSRADDVHADPVVEGLECQRFGEAKQRVLADREDAGL